MKERLISYLAAVFLNLALVTALEPSPRVWRLARPALVRLFEGARVTARLDASECGNVRIGLLLGGRLHLAAADPHERLFPRTLRWDGLEPTVAVLN